jgi:hypothetical protein
LILSIVTYFERLFLGPEVTAIFLVVMRLVIAVRDPGHGAPATAAGFTASGEAFTVGEDHQLRRWAASTPAAAGQPVMSATSSATNGPAGNTDPALDAVVAALPADSFPTCLDWLHTRAAGKRATSDVFVLGGGDGQVFSFKKNFSFFLFLFRC